MINADQENTDACPIVHKSRGSKVPPWVEKHALEKYRRKVQAWHPWAHVNIHSCMHLLQQILKNHSMTMKTINAPPRAAAQTPHALAAT
mmetsp:Transcript_26061/g.54883  ORF Transcript_26061/g.54883 Transcript_26061/m.54883 type:complete len:89 (-) Transcript_26061:371-637(-)